jgi:hypothetical protein
LPAETRAYVAKLRPFWNGGDVAGPLTAQAKAAAWRAAPLFTTGAFTTGVNRRLDEQALIDGPTPLSVRDLFAVRHPSSELFIRPDVRKLRK